MASSRTKVEQIEIQLPQLPNQLAELIEQSEERANKESSNEVGLMDPSKSVVLSNRFVIGIEQGSRFAHKISRIAISQIPMKAKELPFTTITAKDMEELGMGKTRLTGHLADVIDEILSYRIMVSAMDTFQRPKIVHGVNVFSQAWAIAGKGAITVQLNSVLREHFLELNKEFTQYSLPVVSKMPGFAASKLHELLLCYSRKFGKDLFLFSIDDLVVLLDYKPKGEYKASSFVNSSIKRAVASINDYTESSVKYKAIRKGREYAYIRFLVDSTAKTWEEKKEAEERKLQAMAESHETRKMFLKAQEQEERRLNTGDGEIVV